jgi:hypothetical protein
MPRERATPHLIGRTKLSAYATLTRGQISHTPMCLPICRRLMVVTARLHLTEYRSSRRPGGRGMLQYFFDDHLIPGGLLVLAAGVSGLIFVQRRARSH